MPTLRYIILIACVYIHVHRIPFITLQQTGGTVSKDVRQEVADFKIPERFSLRVMEFVNECSDQRMKTDIIYSR